MADLSRARFYRANRGEASLRRTILVETDFAEADLTGCRVYGASAWGVALNGNTKQQNLIITDEGEPEITMDNIEVAQFIYLLLQNLKIRDVIDTITSKAVLILGRFTNERKGVLDALRDELRKRDYLPILFDFDKPTSRTTDETITLLARMARFVIADISDAKSVLQELRAIIPELPSVPVQPVIIAAQEEPGMFDFYQGRPSFLPVHRYDTPVQLLAHLSDRVIGPAEAKVSELRAITVTPPLNPKTTP
jgi:Pentapeptide repeats (8 copies)